MNTRSLTAITIISILLVQLTSCLPVKLPPSTSVKKDVFKSKKWTLAVIDFDYEFQGSGKEGANSYTSAGKDGGKVIANMLAAELNKIDDLKILERSAINKVLEEQKMQVSGVIDESTAVELGKMIGADAVMLGNVTDYLNWTNITGISGSTISFSARMIDISSSQLLLSTSITRIRTGVLPAQNVQLTTQEVYESISKELQ
jgi:curli biogenesis system outer membrane secretion channel CsgG